MSIVQKMLTHIASKQNASFSDRGGYVCVCVERRGEGTKADER